MVYQIIEASANGQLEKLKFSKQLMSVNIIILDCSLQKSVTLKKKKKRKEERNPLSPHQENLFKKYEIWTMMCTSRDQCAWSCQIL